MNRFIKVSLSVLISGNFLVSCATKEYVQEQIKPIKEKVEAIDKRLTKVEEKISKLQSDIKINKNDIDSMKKEHEDIKDKIIKLETRTDEALNIAHMADKKSDKNAENIKVLEAKLKRTNRNIQRVIEKGLRK